MYDYRVEAEPSHSICCNISALQSHLGEDGKRMFNELQFPDKLIS